ncbi:Receptor-like protein 13 [Bienertia sinuspersici]
MGSLPSWIGNFSRLTSLSMSHNKLQGRIPTQICNLQLTLLDLSQNNFSGSILSCPNSCPFSYMHLHNNSLSGEIPNALSLCTRIKTLDLSGNRLSGRIPLWINKLSRLTILMLARNNLHGQIPQQLCHLGDINILDLSHNNLSGGIPICIGNLSFGMKFTIDIGKGDRLRQPHPTWDDAIDLNFYYKPEEVEFLNKNQLLLYKGKNLVMMSLLDLSSNKLIGSIPSQFSNLKHVESLDLSFNRLSGKIPSQLVELTFLEIFNVSYNDFSGRVPDTGQFASFDERNYYGNPRLLGYHTIKAFPPTAGAKQDESYDQAAILYSNSQWRRAWFEFVDYHILQRYSKFKLNLY